MKGKLEECEEIEQIIEELSTIESDSRNGKKIKNSIQQLKQMKAQA